MIMQTFACDIDCKGMQILVNWWFKIYAIDYSSHRPIISFILIFNCIWQWHNGYPETVFSFIINSCLTQILIRNSMPIVSVDCWRWEVARLPWILPFFINGCFVFFLESWGWRRCSTKPQIHWLPPTRELFWNGLAGQLGGWHHLVTWRCKAKPPSTSSGRLDSHGNNTDSSCLCTATGAAAATTGYD